MPGGGGGRKVGHNRADKMTPFLQRGVSYIVVFSRLKSTLCAIKCGILLFCFCTKFVFKKEVMWRTAEVFD